MFFVTRNSKIALVFTHSAHDDFRGLKMFFEIISGSFLGIKGTYSHKKRFEAQISEIVS